MGPGAEAVPRLPAGDGPGQRLRALRVQRQGARRRGAGHLAPLPPAARWTALKRCTVQYPCLFSATLQKDKKLLPELCIYIAPRFLESTPVDS